MHQTAKATLILDWYGGIVPIPAQQAHRHKTPVGRHAKSVSAKANTPN